jgi:hypothetical protein
MGNLGRASFCSSVSPPHLWCAVAPPTICHQPTGGVLHNNIARMDDFVCLQHCDSVPATAWRLGCHMLACCPGARPMLEAGTSLPRGQTNAGGWDFICSLAAQGQTNARHATSAVQCRSHSGSTIYSGTQRIRTTLAHDSELQSRILEVDVSKHIKTLFCHR